MNTAPTSSSEPQNFEDLVWLFRCDSRNRGIIRQGFDEAALLWKAVRATGGDIIEVGRNYAGSTVLLAAASGLSRTIWSIDLRSEYNPRCADFLADEANSQRVHLLVQDSRKPLADVRCGFLFIDGDHSFEGVLADVVAHWNSLHDVGQPGLAAFHDALPNDNFRWRDEDRRAHRAWTRLKNKFRQRQKPEIAPDYSEGVNRVCKRLVDLGLAEEWGKASSMLVLRKKGDLPANFAQSFL